MADQSPSTCRGVPHGKKDWSGCTGKTCPICKGGRRSPVAAVRTLCTADFVSLHWLYDVPTERLEKYVASDEEVAAGLQEGETLGKNWTPFHGLAVLGVEED